MKIISAGIIFCHNKILIAQRSRNKSLAYKWEFPGGKLEEGETLEECLKREIKEELDLEITVGEKYMTTTHEYEFGSFQLNVFLAECQTEQAGELTAHECIRWVSPDELENYDFSAADLPIVEKIKADKKLSS